MTSSFVKIDVSPEMVTLIGSGDLERETLPEKSALFVISLGRTASVSIASETRGQDPVGEEEGVRTLALVVMRSALERLFGWSPAASDGMTYFLTHQLSAIAATMLADERRAEATTTYRLAKSIELLCDLVAALQDGNLVLQAGGSSLSHSDGVRLVAARRIIDEQWSEKLTLDRIARSCGLNRTKLSKGFREIYRCSVSEALVERRLAEARRQLLSTDLPVGVIGYRSGYSNNASFTRAFGRHFGQSPTDLRSCGVAA